MAGVLVHEWIAQAGGSENVLEALAGAYPDADILCLWNDSTGRFDPARIHETWLAKTPLRRSKALALPFLPGMWRHRKNEGYDWAILSSHLFAHHARFDGPEIPRYAYIHSPARYIWTPEFDARGGSLPVRLLGAPFKPLDRRRAHEGTSYAANSEFVRERIAATWEVDSRVIHPPVDVAGIQAHADWAEQLSGEDRAQLDALPAEFALGASRFIPYKRLDTVIRTGEVLGLPVVLAGKGPELDRLRVLAADATVPVHFVLAPSGPLLWALYQRASLYVFPAVEDFGIMPVEAMAAGAAVLAPGVGGTAETVVDGVTGALVDFASDTEIGAAAARAMSTTAADRVAHARTFGLDRFVGDIREWVGE
jgi:glycosyltransferase involved in cell wall biosynthesis